MKRYQIVVLVTVCLLVLYYFHIQLNKMQTKLTTLSNKYDNIVNDNILHNDNIDKIINMINNSVESTLPCDAPTIYQEPVGRLATTKGVYDDSDRITSGGRTILNPEVTNQGATVECANQGATVESANQGVTVECANQGATVECANQGAAAECANQGATAECANQGATVECTNQGANVQCTNQGAAAECANQGAAVGKVCYDQSTLDTESDAFNSDSAIDTEDNPVEPVHVIGNDTISSYSNDSGDTSIDNNPVALISKLSNTHDSALSESDDINTTEFNVVIMDANAMNFANTMNQVEIIDDSPTVTDVQPNHSLNDIQSSTVDDPYGATTNNPAGHMMFFQDQFAREETHEQVLRELQTTTRFAFDADQDDQTTPQEINLTNLRTLSPTEIPKLKSRFIKELASELNISTKTDDGGKKKTKKELVTEILEIKKNI